MRRNADMTKTGVTNNFRVGSIYYDSGKQFYLLVTEKTKDGIAGYTSRYGNPTMHDKFVGYNTERIGVFEFNDGTRIAFGNPFRGKLTDKTFPKFTYLRSLAKYEFQTFKMITQFIIDRKLVYKSFDGTTRAIR